MMTRFPFTGKQGLWLTRLGEGGRAANSQFRRCHAIGSLFWEATNARSKALARDFAALTQPPSRSGVRVEHRILRHEPAGFFRPARFFWPPCRARGGLQLRPGS